MRDCRSFIGKHMQALLFGFDSEDHLVRELPVWVGAGHYEIGRSQLLLDESLFRTNSPSYVCMSIRLVIHRYSGYPSTP